MNPEYILGLILDKRAAELTEMVGVSSSAIFVKVVMSGNTQIVVSFAKIGSSLYIYIDGRQESVERSSEMP